MLKHHRELLIAGLHDAFADGVRSLCMSLNASQRFLADPQGLLDNARALRGACPPELKVTLAVGINRPYHEPREQLHELVQACVRSELFGAVDLYGQEVFDEIEFMAPLYEEAKCAGLYTMVHAGEFSSAQTIERVLDVLQPDAIMHGIRSVDSEELLRRLAQAEVTLHVCPTSNVKLGAASSIADHPLRKLLDAGVRATVNSDDPVLFGAFPSDEYRALHQSGMYSIAELDAMRVRGLRELDGPWTVGARKPS